MASELINRVAQSGLLTIDLQKFADDLDFISFDLKDYLFRELILKEKDFREAIKNIDTQVYKDRQVLIYCSKDVIIPMWAYMLVAAQLSNVAKNVLAISPAEFAAFRWISIIDKMDLSIYADQRVIIKGCNEINLPPAAYTHLTQLLLPHVKSLMFGEPCSTVPIFKRKSENVE